MVEMRIPHDVPLDRVRTLRIAPAPPRPGQPARPSLALVTSLDAVRRAPTILAAIRLAPRVREATVAAINEGSHPAFLLKPLLEAIQDERDTVTAVAAIHALGEVPGRLVESEMARLLGRAVNGFDAHAALAVS